MGEVLKYTDSDKSSFFKCWWKYEKKIQSKAFTGTWVTCCSVKPAIIDVMITDAMFFLHLLVDPPSTLGSIAQYIYLAAFV